MDKILIHNLEKIKLCHYFSDAIIEYDTESEFYLYQIRTVGQFKKSII